MLMLIQIIQKNNQLQTDNIISHIDNGENFLILELEMIK